MGKHCPSIELFEIFNHLALFKGFIHRGDIVEAKTARGHPGKSTSRYEQRNQA